LGKNTTSTVEGIGQQVGYRSKAAFIRAFRRTTGTSPMAYPLDRQNQPVWHDRVGRIVASTISRLSQVT
jgi:AraC-like DNA-binding protein